MFGFFFDVWRKRTTQTDGVFVWEEKISPSLALYGLDGDLSSFVRKKEIRERAKNVGE